MLGELVVAALACMAVLAGVYWAVPTGPECPRCGAIAPRRRGASVLPSLGNLLFAVGCPVCGWNGHVRRRPPAAALAPVRRRGRR